MCNLVHLDKLHSEFLMCVAAAAAAAVVWLRSTHQQREFNALSCISAFCILCLPAAAGVVADNAFVYLTALSALVAFA